MKKSYAIITVILFSLILATKGFARNCPSLINSNLHEVNDYLEFGDELRTFYFGIDRNNFENNYLAGLKLLTNIYPTDSLAIVGEIDLRYKYGGWQGEDKLVKFRLNQLFLEYDGDNFSVTPGIQFFTFSSGAVLDQRFMGLSTQYNTKYADISLFAGMTKKDMMKSSVNCLWRKYNNENDSWRILSENMKNLGAGLTLSIKKLNPYFLQALVLLANTEIEQQKSLSFSLAGGGPIIKRKFSFTSDLILFKSYDNYLLPGVVLQTIVSPFGQKMPILKTGFASAFRYNDNERLSPVFENLTWGIIRRYSIHNNHVVYSKIDWQIKPFLKPYVHYYYQFDDYDTGYKSNEVDAGLKIVINDKYLFNLAYIGMDTFSKERISNGFYFESRIIF